MFYLLTGKTIGSYIRERRLTEAGTDIKKGEKVLDVAKNYIFIKKELDSKLSSFLNIYYQCYILNSHYLLYNLLFLI